MPSLSVQQEKWLISLRRNLSQIRNVLENSPDSTGISETFSAVNTRLLSEPNLAVSVFNLLFEKDNLLEISRQMCSMPLLRQAKKSVSQLMFTLIRLLSVSSILTVHKTLINYLNTVFVVESQAETRTSALCCLQELFKKLEGSDRVEMVEKVTKQVLVDCGRTCTSSNLKSERLKLLGCACKRFPQQTVSYRTQIFDLVTHCLRSEMTSKLRKPDLSVVAGCFEALRLLLHQVETERKSELYSLLRMALNTQIVYSRFVVPKSALSVLAEHSDYFGDLLLDDYQTVYERLCWWCSRTNREVRVIANQAIEAFLSTLSHSLCRRSDNGKEVFVFLLEQFKTRMDKTDQTTIDPIAVKGYGCLAAPSKHFGQPGDVQKMFESVCQKAFGLSSFRNESWVKTSEHNHQLGILFHALAMIALETDQSDLDKLIPTLRTLCIQSLCIRKTPRRLLGPIFNFKASLKRVLTDSAFKNQFLFPMIYHLVCHYVRQKRGDEQIEDDDKTNFLNTIRALTQMPDQRKSGYSRDECQSLRQCLVEQVGDAIGRLLEERVDPDELVELAKTILVGVANSTEWAQRLLDKITDQVRDATHIRPLLEIASTLIPLVDSIPSDLVKLLAFLLPTEPSSCLQCLLLIPFDHLTQLVVDIDRLAKSIRTALEFGAVSENAETILECLLRWTDETDQIGDVLQTVAPALNSFVFTMINKDDSAEKSEFLRSSMRLDQIQHLLSRQQSRGVLALDTYLSSAEKLFRADRFERIRDLVFGLVAKMDGKSKIQMMANNRRNRIDNHHHFDFRPKLLMSIPLRDSNPTVSMTGFLARAHRLILSSPDKQLRSSAAELVHALIILAVGRESTNQDQLTPAMIDLVLELASHTDPLIKNLFSSLSIQLCRWYCLESKSAQIHTIYDTVVKAFSIQFRRPFCEFILRYLVSLVLACPIVEAFNSCRTTLATLHETVAASAGTLQSVGLSSAFKCLPKLIDRFLWSTGNMATNCNLESRSAACHAILSYFDLLNELFDRHAYVLLYRFIESACLAQEDDSVVGRVLWKLAETLVGRVDFLGGGGKCLKPPTWSNASVDICVRWLIRCIGRPNRHVREVSIWLVEKLVAKTSFGRIESKPAKYYEKRLFERPIEQLSIRELEGYVCAYTWLSQFFLDLETFEALLPRVQNHLDDLQLLKQSVQFVLKLGTERVAEEFLLAVVDAVVKERLWRGNETFLGQPRVIDLIAKVIDRDNLSQKDLLLALYQLKSIDRSSYELKPHHLRLIQTIISQVRKDPNIPGRLKLFGQALFLLYCQKSEMSLSEAFAEFEWIINDSQPYELIHTFARVTIDWISRERIDQWPSSLGSIRFLLTKTSSHLEFTKFVGVLIKRVADNRSLWRFDSQNVFVLVDLVIAAVENSPKGFERSLDTCVLSLISTLLVHESIELERRSRLFQCVSPLIKWLMNANDSDDRLLCAVYKFFVSSFPLSRRELSGDLRAIFDRVCLDLANGIAGGLCSQQCFDFLKFFIGVLARDDEDTMERECLRVVLDGFKHSPVQIALLSLLFDQDKVRSNSSRFMRPFLIETPNPILIDFVSSRIEVLMECLADRSDLKSACFCADVLSVSFERLTKNDLASETSSIARLYSQAKYKRFDDPKIFLKDSIRILRRNVVETSVDENVELIRRFRCSSLNALISLFIKTQTELKLFYAFIFKEDFPKKETVFDGIIDSNRVYKFDKMIEETDVCSSEEPTDSEVQLQLDAFDFNLDSSDLDHLPPPIPHVNPVADELNKHECMAKLVSLIEFLSSFHHADPSSTQIPNWVQAIIRRLQYPRSGRNVRLLLMRLVVLCRDRLKVFSAHFAPVLMDCVSLGHCGIESFDWFLTEVMAMLVSWSTQISVDVMKRFAEFTIPLVYNSNREILRSNFGVFAEFVKTYAPTIRACQLRNFEWTDDSSKFVINMLVLMIGEKALDPDERCFELFCTQSGRRAIEGMAMCVGDDSERFLKCRSVLGEMAVDQRINCLARIGEYCPRMVREFLGELVTGKESGRLFGAMADLVDQCLSWPGVVESAEDAQRVLMSLDRESALGYNQLRLIRSSLGLVDNDLQLDLIARAVSISLDQKESIEVMLDICSGFVESSTQQSLAQNFFVRVLYKAHYHAKDSFYGEIARRVIQKVKKSTVAETLAALFPRDECDQSRFVQMWCDLMLEESSRQIQYQKTIFESSLLGGDQYAPFEWNPESRRPVENTGPAIYETIASVIEISSVCCSDSIQVFDRRKRPDLVRDELFEKMTKRRRFSVDIKDPEKASMVFGSRVWRKYADLSERANEHSASLLNQFSVCRRYDKLSQVPDIRIRVSDVIEPLRKVCLMDSDCASHLFGCLIRGVLEDASLLVSETEHRALVKQVWRELFSIANESKDHTLVCTMLWSLRMLVSEYSDCCMDWGNVNDLLNGIVSSDNVLAGIHFFEDFAIHTALEDKTQNSLNRLYQLVGDHSCVGGRVFDLEMICDYERSLSEYSARLDDQNTNVYLEACVRCCALMGKWNRIPRLIQQTLLAPSFSEALKILSDDLLSSQLIHSQMRIDPRSVCEILLDYESPLRSTNPLETSICCLATQNLDGARTFIGIAKDRFFEAWKRALMAPVSAAMSTVEIQKLVAPVTQIDMIQTAFKAISDRKPCDLNPLKLDLDDHATFAWDIQIAFHRLLTQILDKLSYSSNYSSPSKNLDFENAKCALHQHNYALSLTKLKQSGLVPNIVDQPNNFNTDAALCYVSAHLERALRTVGFVQRLTDSSCFALLKASQNELTKNEDPELRNRFADILEKMFVYALGDQEAADALCEWSFAQRQSFRESSIDVLSKIAVNRMIVARYANQCLYKDPSSASMAKIFVESLLIALETNKAISFVPRLVQVLGYHEHLADLIDLKKVPVWIFLGSVDGLCSLTQTNAVRSLLKELVESYPEQVYFPFKLSAGSGQFFDRLQEWLDRSTFLDSFERALSTLQNPDQIFRAWKNRLLKNPQEAETAFTQLYNNLLNARNEFLGTFTRHFALSFGSKVKAIFGEPSALRNLDNIEATLKNIETSMSRYCEKMPEEIDAYSSWFTEIHLSMKRRLELPGQFDSSLGPDQLRLSIIGFSLEVVVLSSLRRPKRIRVRLDDGSERCLMVKAGEDLRQDELITRLFRNGFAGDDDNVRSYQVIPLNSQLGLIEWLPNTKTLRYFMETGMSDDERSRFMSKRPSDRYAEHIARFASSKSSLAEQYLSVYSADSVLMKRSFERICSRIPRLMLRNAYLAVSVSSADFVSRRRNYVRSLAAISALTYCLGIGDRHLNNFLVDLSNGDLIAIDFGCAFGEARVNLPIPELVPFRLTRQLRTPMLPVGVRGLFRSLMVGWIRNLGRRSDELFAQLNDSQASNVRLRLGGGVVMVSELESGIHRARIDEIKLVLGNLNSADNNLRVEDQVDELIAEATNDEILCRTWVGWEPFM